MGLPSPVLGPTALALCCAAALACGCGGGSKPVVVTRTVTEQAPAPATTAMPPQRTTAAAHPSQAPARFVHLSLFQTPSHNIACAIAGGEARCDIDRRTWTPPPRPASCPPETGYGQGAYVGTSGRARFVCAGDTTKNPSARVLAYGTATDVAPFVCVSRTNGLTCTNARTGHGFTLSIQGYRLF